MDADKIAAGILVQFVINDTWDGAPEYTVGMAGVDPGSPEMQREASNDPELAELPRREPIFHHPEFGTSRSDFEKMTVEDCWETGASGQRYSREQILDILEGRFSSRREDVWQAKEFRCRRLCRDTYLLTYTLLQDNKRLTRRATIWQHTPEGWKIVYHQGTLVQDA